MEQFQATRSVGGEGAGLGSAVIFGGAGFIGTHLARELLASGRFRRIVVADLEPSPLVGSGAGLRSVRCDVRAPIAPQLGPLRCEWAFNLAAVHREPGHRPEEYFATNLHGAENVCAWAAAVDCRRIAFLSSIAVYGAIRGRADEGHALAPCTPYGGSKLGAELVHRQWRRARDDRRLVIARPSVVYGPGDPGNVPRMIRAIRAGRFVLPGARRVVKSSAYVFGLIDALAASLAWPEPELIFNYADHPAEPLSALVAAVQHEFGGTRIVPRVPLAAALAAARALDLALLGRSPVSPERVRKAATPTHVVPRVLLARGWRFPYAFARALADWRLRAPQDFGERPLAPVHDFAATRRWRQAVRERRAA